MFPWRKNQVTAKGALNVVIGHILIANRKGHGSGIVRHEEYPIQQEGDSRAEAIDESQPHDRTKTHNRQTPISLRGRMVINATRQRQQR
ncbi:hypothetical protein GBA52_008535 [Prunus armeniaca]|nr:hypothetical protein GBA52_008535 [Prunus armeniaca]